MFATYLMSREVPAVELDRSCRGLGKGLANQRPTLVGLPRDANYLHIG